jgi:hypothetical protein
MTKQRKKRLTLADVADGLADLKVTTAEIYDGVMDLKAAVEHGFTQQEARLEARVAKTEDLTWRRFDVIDGRFDVRQQLGRRRPEPLLSTDGMRRADALPALDRRVVRPR